MGKSEEDVVGLEVVGTPVEENVGLVEGALPGLREGEKVGEYILETGALEFVGV